MNDVISNNILINNNSTLMESSEKYLFQVSLSIFYFPYLKINPTSIVRKQDYYVLCL